MYRFLVGSKLNPENADWASNIPVMFLRVQYNYTPVIYIENELDGYSFYSSSSLFIQNETDGYTIEIII
jgi:hypothetical protein